MDCTIRVAKTKALISFAVTKGADQLRGYRKADLRLCFRICKKPVISRRGSYNLIMLTCLCNVEPLLPNFYIVKLVFTGVYNVIMFLFLL